MHSNNRIPSQQSKPQKKSANQFLEEQLSGISGFSGSEDENESFEMKANANDSEQESGDDDDQTASDASDEYAMPEKSHSPIKKQYQRPQTAQGKTSANFATFNANGLTRPLTSHSQQTLNLERPGTSHSSKL